MRLTSQKVRTELRDLLELFLVPAVAAVLPWPLAFRLQRKLVAVLNLYPTGEVAQRQAAARGWVGDAAHWAGVRRLVTLVDHVDLPLSRTRSDAWMASHMDVEGQWPPPSQPGIIFTFHWGAGMWGLRHARASGLKAHALVAPLQGKHFSGRRVLLAYARARTAEVARALGCPTLDTSTSLRPALLALRRGEQIVAAVDVPSDQVSASEEVTLLGMPARVPRGLLRLAVDQQVAVTVYLTGLHPATGRRFLRIHQLGIHDDVKRLTALVFGYLDAAIREDPPSWHFWSEADRIFVGPAGQPPASATGSSAAEHQVPGTREVE